MAEKTTAKDTAKAYSLEECQEHVTEKSCWLAIYGKVYDVTDFLDEHPGGYDIVVAAAGKDATEDFDEIGHSSTAKEMLEEYLIGSFSGGEGARLKKPPSAAELAASSSKSSPVTALLKALLPLILIVLGIAFYLQQSKA